MAAVYQRRADMYGVLDSITQVLSHGGQRTGLQWSTVRSIAFARVVTLPVAILLSGSLHFLLRQLT